LKTFFFFPLKFLPPRYSVFSQFTTTFFTPFLRSRFSFTPVPPRNSRCWSFVLFPLTTVFSLLRSSRRYHSLLNRWSPTPPFIEIPTVKALTCPRPSPPPVSVPPFFSFLDSGAGIGPRSHPRVFPEVVELIELSSTTIQCPLSLPLPG